MAVLLGMGTAHAQSPMPGASRAHTQAECDTYKRNRIATLEKQGLSQEKARAKAASEDDGVCGLAEAVRKDREKRDKAAMEARRARMTPQQWEKYQRDLKDAYEGSTR